MVYGLYDTYQQCLLSRAWLTFDGYLGEGSSKATRKQQKKREKADIAAQRFTVRNVPINEQTQDLTEPGDSALVSQERRAELTKSLRGARRKSIKERNFLKSM